ncbi:uncharacterized protein LTR77_009208 [Saxophila tyrrhenica]|uniref:HTH APSES-type domain-containing protein n=1 Tax=Saxophila tyrrhenica TaxID=1690608 RepID=A0AAV9NYE9_9PEZI|nr:hypothetical protein LTR77_009208 [Saxophila tyrrhenica]
MATRQLPEDVNPLVEDENAPAYEILVERRCLGQTELKVKADHVGTTNATKPDNLGKLDYAHLRIPLPGDLTNSGIFTKQGNRKWPEAYFLMRRSTDGYVSATGMFKAAFPWAQVEEENAEKEYIKSLENTSSEEVAGNVWIHPEQALSLADEYGIRIWIDALLDPEPITHGTSDPKKLITSPPTFRTKDVMNGTSSPRASASKSPEADKKKPVVDGRRSTRGNSTKPATTATRSESPAKKTPARVKATPRKARKTRGKSTEPDLPAPAPADANGSAASPKPEASDNDNVKVQIESEHHPSPTGDGDEIDHTNLKIEMPASHPDLELPESAEGMLEQARSMVEAANQVDGRRITSPGAWSTRGKRKAAELGEEGEELGMGPAAKRARKAELELRKERLRRRALVGIAGSLALGAIVPSIMAAFGS